MSVSPGSFQMACTGPSLSLCPQLWAQCLVCGHEYFLPECQTHCLGMGKTKMQVRLSSALKKGEGFRRWKGHTQQRKKHVFVVTEKHKTHSENSKSVCLEQSVLGQERRNHVHKRRQKPKNNYYVSGNLTEKCLQLIKNLWGRGY